jgi:hypothetical protein
MRRAVHLNHVMPLSAIYDEFCAPDHAPSSAASSTRAPPVLPANDEYEASLATAITNAHMLTS